MERVWSFWWIPLQQKTGWWFFTIHLKNMIVKMGSSSPIFRGENSKTYLSCYHPHKFQKLRLPLDFEHVHSKVSHHRKGVSPFFFKVACRLIQNDFQGLQDVPNPTSFTAWVSFKAVTLHRGIGLDHVMLADTWNGTLWVQRVGAFFLYGANKV